MSELCSAKEFSVAGQDAKRAIIPRRTAQFYRSLLAKLRANDLPA
jgi:hypothetical protein